MNIPYRNILPHCAEKAARAVAAALLCLGGLLLTACSGGSTFEIDGQLLNMNQGTIYVYSPTGLIQSIDTIQIAAGRFQYSRSLEKEGTLVLVFPNFSEIPIFAKPGETAKLKGNAQQLKTLTVSGTADNKLMTAFRLEIAEQTPPKVLTIAEKYIRENPESPVSVWLLERIFLNRSGADLKKCLKLAKTIRKTQQENGQLAELIIKLESMKTLKKGDRLPKFSAKDIKGKEVNNESLKGKKTVIYLSATWDYSNPIDRNIRMCVGSKDYDFRVLKLSLDASKDEAERISGYYPDQSDVRVVCDEKMFNSPLLKKFGLYSMDDNIIVNADGKVLDVNVMPSQITERLR